ncbi:unnamed protein product, partial [Symbiodinium sp. KB8]
DGPGQGAGASTDSDRKDCDDDVDGVGDHGDRYIGGAAGAGATHGGRATARAAGSPAAGADGSGAPVGAGAGPAAEELRTDWAEGTAAFLASEAAGEKHGEAQARPPPPLLQSHSGPGGGVGTGSLGGSLAPPPPLRSSNSSPGALHGAPVSAPPSFAASDREHVAFSSGFVSPLAVSPSGASAAGGHEPWGRFPHRTVPDAAANGGGGVPAAVRGAAVAALGVEPGSRLAPARTDRPSLALRPLPPRAVGGAGARCIHDAPAQDSQPALGMAVTAALVSPAGLPRRLPALPLEDAAQPAAPALRPATAPGAASSAASGGVQSGPGASERPDAADAAAPKPKGRRQRRTSAVDIAPRLRGLAPAVSAGLSRRVGGSAADLPPAPFVESSHVLGDGAGVPFPVGAATGVRRPSSGLHSLANTGPSPLGSSRRQSARYEPGGAAQPYSARGKLSSISALSASYDDTPPMSTDNHSDMQLLSGPASRTNQRVRGRGSGTQEVARADMACDSRPATPPARHGSSPALAAGRSGAAAALQLPDHGIATMPLSSTAASRRVAVPPSPLSPGHPASQSGPPRPARPQGELETGSRESPPGRPPVVPGPSEAPRRPLQPAAADEAGAAPSTRGGSVASGADDEAAAGEIAPTDGLGEAGEALPPREAILAAAEELARADAALRRRIIANARVTAAHAPHRGTTSGGKGAGAGPGGSLLPSTTKVPPSPLRPGGARLAKAGRRSPLRHRPAAGADPSSGGARASPGKEASSHPHVSRLRTHSGSDSGDLGIDAGVQREALQHGSAAAARVEARLGMAAGTVTPSASSMGRRSRGRGSNVRSRAHPSSTSSSSAMGTSSRPSASRFFPSSPPMGGAGGGAAFASDGSSGAGDGADGLLGLLGPDLRSRNADFGAGPGRHRSPTGSGQDKALPRQQRQRRRQGASGRAASGERGAVKRNARMRHPDKRDPRARNAGRDERRRGAQSAERFGTALVAAGSGATGSCSSEDHERDWSDVDHDGEATGATSLDQLRADTAALLRGAQRRHPAQPAPPAETGAPGGVPDDSG